MQSEFKALIGQIIPRALTQVCRDPDSANYGSWDRNFWHYKIRDFSSIILQQGGYLLLQAARLEEYADKAEYFKGLARASVDFWDKRAQKFGAFEEYYPYERSYPGLAFSTLAIAKIIRDLELDPLSYKAGMHMAIKQLEAREELEASNQYLAGLAALYVLSEIMPDLVDKAILDKSLRQVLNTQSSEGWFNEYDGPDLGYLSVSIDCLWDIYDVLGSEEVLESIRKAITFIDGLLIAPQSIGLHNSRQTDYIVPYGIIRMTMIDDDPAHVAAHRIALQLFSTLNDPDHFFTVIDDRYWVHYIGHSVVRAYAWGGKLQLATASAARLAGFDTSSCRNGTKFRESKRLCRFADETTAILGFDTSSCRKRQDVASTFKRQDDASTIRHYPEAGYIVIRKEQYSGLISTRKGGIMSIYGNDGQRFADYGSELQLGNKIYVMNWWGSSRLLQFEDNRVTIKGSFVPTQEHISSPIKHLVLRVASLSFGASIISSLKRLLIFKTSKSPYAFTRTITMGEKEIRIVDATSCRNIVEATSCRLSLPLSLWPRSTRPGSPKLSKAKVWGGTDVSNPSEDCRRPRLHKRHSRFHMSHVFRFLGLRLRSTRDVSNPLIKKALAFSKRHVASANSFNPENASMIKNCKVETTQKWTGNELQQTTIIHL